MRSKLSVFAMALVLSLAALPAAGWAAKHEAEPNTSQLIKRIRHELVTLPFYSVFDHFEFQIDGSKVTLLGQVNRPTLKSSAERVVARLEGVSEVDNRIQVLPVSSHDDSIRRAVFAAIYRHPALDRYGLRAVPPIHIIVNNGHVTLEGAVARESDKNIAFLQANSVGGVFSVTNHLWVENTKTS